MAHRRFAALALVGLLLAPVGAYGVAAATPQPDPSQPPVHPPPPVPAVQQPAAKEGPINVRLTVKTVAAHDAPEPTEATRVVSRDNVTWTTTTVVVGGYVRSKDRVEWNVTTTGTVRTTVAQVAVFSFQNALVNAPHGASSAAPASQATLAVHVWSVGQAPLWEAPPSSTSYQLATLRSPQAPTPPRAPDPPPEPDPEADPSDYVVVVDAKGLVSVYELPPPGPAAEYAPASAPAPATGRSPRRNDRVEILLASQIASGTPTLLLLAIALGALAAALIFSQPSVGALLFSRFNRHDVLEHARRAELYDAIRENPGTTFGALRERFGLVTGVAQHHLRQLEQHGLVASVHRGRSTYYYPRGPRLPDALPPVGAQARLVDILRARPGLTARELAAAVGRCVQTTWEQLDRLRVNGHVASEADGRRLRWRCARA